MKYRIEQAWPEGFRVRGSVLGLRWKQVFYDSFGNLEKGVGLCSPEYVFKTIDDAKKAVNDLKLEGTVYE